MRLVVTGGSGFIGSNFIRFILREHADWNVLNIDKLTYAGNPENLAEIADDPRYRFVQEDICSPAAGELLKGADVVVNFAAETHVDRSLLEPEIFLKTDVLGTFNLIEAVKKHHVRRLVQISTDEVYGSIADGSFTEESPLTPSNPYSASKAGADLLVLSNVRTYGLPAVIVRSSNNYGPNQYPEKFIPLFITNAIEDKSLPVYGDGRQRREWLYVEDNCRGIETALLHGRDGEIYNISSGNEQENIVVAKRILQLLGKPETLLKYVKDRLGHDRRYSIAADKLRRLGWSPAFSFEDGLARTVRWYRENTDWWKKIKDGSFRDYYARQYSKR